MPTPTRNRLPATRVSLTHKFEIGDHDGYIIVGLYNDGLGFVFPDGGANASKSNLVNRTGLVGITFSHEITYWGNRGKK